MLRRSRYIEHHDDDHHVHFDAIKDDFESDHSNPVIQKGQHGKINIHLGFLQVKHRYRIELNIPAEFLVDHIQKSHKLVLKVDEADVPNIHCKLLSFKGDTTEQLQFYEAEIEFFAHKEKLLKEELKLTTSDEKPVKFVFSARVLGRGKGTPMLKNGIHLLGIEDDEESGELCNTFLVTFCILSQDDFIIIPQMPRTGKDFRERNVMSCRRLNIEIKSM